MQKPPFCTPKTILLHGKNYTFVLRICNIHRMNTLQTFRKISTFNYEIPNEHSAKYQRTPPKHPTYTPPGVGADSSCPYFPIIKYVYSFHRKHISVRHFVDIYGFAGAIYNPQIEIVSPAETKQYFNIFILKNEMV